MARSLSVGSRQYAAGSYGPYSVDSFLSTDTDYLELSMTVENWPTRDGLVTGQLRWNTGDGQDFGVNSPPRNRDGSIRTVVTIRLPVPQDASGKVAVTSGTARLQLAAPIQTAISVVAGTYPAA